MEVEEALSFIVNSESRKRHTDIETTKYFSHSIALTARRFHYSLPLYQPTPLVRLNNLAHTLGVAGIWVKDESYRFGLNAFKVLGASFAVAHVLAERIGINEDNLSFDSFKSIKKREELRGITFVTATDGNHGRALAWVAQRLGCSAVVYMPKGSSRARLEAIREYGAQTSIVDGNYDDAVHLASEQAQKNNWVLVQDTAWRGYERVPIRIIQGYLTIMNEALEQLCGEIPTHVFIQCGVGSLATSMQAYLLELFGRARPTFVVVEPHKAACFYYSMVINDGNPHKVSGNLHTIMAGLACGEPNILAWRILRAYTDLFVACDDSFALKGMRILGKPIAGDKKVISGESGAVTTGLIASILRDSTYIEIKEALGITRGSKILLISTEGDTDPDIYQTIMSSGDV